MECSPTYETPAVGIAANRLSQSPSIMECSPTQILPFGFDGFVVAVPVNYGMLSNNRDIAEVVKTVLLSQSPSIMECSPTKKLNKIDLMDLSQSPSIMECSPTLKLSRPVYDTIVAVPVNYGMLSYKNKTAYGFLEHLSQSPSIMECSPTQS